MVVLVWAPRADHDAAPGSEEAGYVTAQTPGTGDCSRASGELGLEPVVTHFYLKLDVCDVSVGMLPLLRESRLVILENVSRL